MLGKVAAAASAVYGAYRAYGEAKKLFTGKDEQGNDLDTAGKVKAVAHLAVQGALTTIGGILGGPQGAAFAAGLAPLITDVADQVGNMLVGTKVGDALGRALATVLDPVTELPKLWNDVSGAISGALGKVADIAMSLGGKVKDKVANLGGRIASAGGSAIQSTVEAAKSVGSTVSGWWNKGKEVVAGTASEVAPVIQAQAANVGSKVASAAKSVAAAVTPMASTAVSAAKQGYTSISDAAGKLFRPKDGSVNMDGLQPAVQQNFMGMAQEYKDMTGRILPVNSAYRSYEQQAAEYAKDPNKAAKPGRSVHQSGIAIDTNSEDGNRLDSLGLLAKWGFSRPAKTKKGERELWHLQVAGSAKKAVDAGYQVGDNPGDGTTSVVRQTSEMVAANDSSVGTRPVAVGASPTITPRPAAATNGAPGALAGGGNPPLNNSARMSADSVPTFSYADSTFFALNLGALA
jgi:hypothetical protein